MSWTFAIAAADEAITARTLRSWRQKRHPTGKPAIGKYAPSTAPNAIVTTRFGLAQDGDRSASVHARLATRTTAPSCFMDTHDEKSPSIYPRESQTRVVDSPARA